MTGGETIAAGFPSKFVDVIKAFDSHERGILFQWVAGSPFGISSPLREALTELLGLKIHNEPFLAMDYTLDWLHAALTCYLEPTAWQTPQPLSAPLITGSQEDVDLVLAWEDERPHLALIEAKGFTGWSNKQMASKASRLGEIFSPAVLDVVDTHFILVGPSRSKGLLTDVWPDWMRRDGLVHFVEIPDPGPRWSVGRLDPLPGPDRVPTVWTSWRPTPRRWQ